MDRTIRLWDVDTGQTIHTLRGHEGTVYEVALAPPDGQRLASASADKTVRLWDTVPGRELTNYTHASDIMGVDFSPDGTRVASGSNDGPGKVWDLSTRQIHTLRGHSQSVVVVRFAAGGTKLASGSFDRTVRLWDLSEVRGSQDRLAGKGMFGRNRKTGMALRTPLAFSSDGSEVFTISTPGDAVLVWHTATGKPQGRWPLDPDTSPLPAGPTGGSKVSFNGLAVSPRHSTLAVAYELGEGSTALTNHVELWNITEDRHEGRGLGGVS